MEELGPRISIIKILRKEGLLQDAFHAGLPTYSRYLEPPLSPGMAMLKESFDQALAIEFGRQTMPNSNSGSEPPMPKNKLS
jgi:hypothetical protein